MPRPLPCEQILKGGLAEHCPQPPDSRPPSFSSTRLPSPHSQCPEEEKPGLHFRCGFGSDFLLPGASCFTRKWRNHEKALDWFLQDQQGVPCHLQCRLPTYQPKSPNDTRHQHGETARAPTPGHCRGGLLFKTLSLEPGLCLPPGVCQALALHRNTS